MSRTCRARSARTCGSGATGQVQQVSHPGAEEESVVLRVDGLLEQAMRELGLIEDGP